jgi:hypothetical protein
MNGGSWVTPPLLFRFLITVRRLPISPFSVIPTEGPRLLRAAVEGPWQYLNPISLAETTTTRRPTPYSKISPRPPVRHARIPHPSARPILMRIPLPRPLQPSSNLLEQLFHHGKPPNPVIPSPVRPCYLALKPLPRSGSLVRNALTVLAEVLLCFHCAVDVYRK